MHRKLRIIGVIVGGILLLLLIAPFFIPVNQFRPTIEREASAVLGRKVQVGNLSLSLLRGKLSAENLVIADDARFSSTPFLTATSVSLDVDVLPLVFSRELRVSSVSIEKPSVTLLHDAKDNWNYASLGTSTTKASPQTSTAKTPSGARGAAASVFIKKLELNDGRVVVGATASKERSVYDHVKVVADNFSMSSEFSVSVAASLPGNGNFKFEGSVGPINTGDATLTPVKASIFLTNPELTLVRHRSGGWSWSFVGISAGGNAKPKPETASAEPTTLPASFLLRKLELKNGRVLLGSEDSNERHAFGQVNVTVDNFSVASQCTYNIIATGPVGEKVKINGKAGPINQTNPALTPVRANILVEKPQLKLVHDKAGSWSWSIGAISSADMKQDGKAPPPKAESAKAESPILPTGLFLERLELKDGSVSVSDPRAKQPSLYQHVNVLATSVGMDAKFPFSISADLPAGGNIKMDGTFGPLDRVEPGFSPLSTKLNVGALDLASTGFLDPALGLGGVVELDAVLTAQSGIEETKGTAKLSRALLVSGGSPSAVPATVEFTTRFDQRTDKGVLNPSTIRIGAAEARLSGTYQIEPDTTVINIKLLGNGMPAKDLQSFLPSVGIRVPKGAALTQGTLNANLDIQGPTNRLVTDGQLGLLGARMAGFDLGAQMASVSSLTGIKTGTVLVIESLTTNVHMATNGLRFDKFNAVVPPLGALAGSGTVDARNNLNLKMAATITSGLAGSVGAMAGSLGSFLGQKSGCKGGSRGTVIPFQILGTAAEPKFVPDVGGTAASLFGSGGCVGSPAPKKKS
jgi:AsmA protein